MVGAAHQDKEHIHPLLNLGITVLHGQSFGLSKAELRDVKVKFQVYRKAKYPELTMSEPEHGKGAKSLTHAEWHRQ